MTVEQRRSASPVLGSATVQEFRANLHGRLVLPTDPDYDDVRAVFNAMIDRRPALIAQCVDTHDVVEAVRFARSHDLLVAVRGGGHSVAGHSVCDDGLLIDLSLMKGVEVDTEKRIAKAQPGLTLGEYVTATEQYGLVSPVGTASDTGIAGLTLGGGYGWLSGKYGMALDNLLAAEVVTADGQVVRASAEEHPDLYWALRGSSGNFGIVTSFEFQLYPVTQVLGGMLIHPFSAAKDVLRYFREAVAAAPDELTIYAALVTPPDGQKVVAMVLCYTGDLEEGERLIQPIREFGPPLADMIHPMPYSEMNTLIDEANPPGMQNYWKWNGLRGVSDEVIEAVVEHYARVPSPRSAILIDSVNGAARRVSPTATAFAHRDAPHGLIVLSMWQDPADAEPNIAWARSLAAATEAYSTGGVYVNGSSDEKARAAYGVNYERLVEVKTQYDPTNFFRHNQNIKPAGETG